ncbi:hypothetical protein DU002_10625 [Corallincola holothuriorum]|uniref:Uncharacterized protein n=1 Tax=Corallincola holothuriorum TaxID=2282215 RepID=A0A368NIX6_9GAMM|nr:hypothetical protein [Corallincola holothuriorum]RCU50060.1 hypothetical protein DU002_10625 [Corallincola holothuriorum]
MDSNIASSLISGFFSVVCAFGAVYLKEHLDAKKARSVDAKPHSVPIVVPVKPVEELQAKSPVAERGKRYSFVRPLLIVIGSFVFGLITRALRPFFSGSINWESLIALVVLVLLALAFALNHRRNGYQLGFQLENFALWTGWSSGWSLIHGNIWGDLVGVVTLWWFACAVIGGLLVAIRRKISAQQPTEVDN